MPETELISIENRLAFKMLEQATKNPEIRKVLANIGELLHEKVIMPIYAAVSKIQDFSELPPQLQAVIKNLAAELTAERRQYGALMPQIASSADIIDKKEHVLDFFEKQSTLIKNCLAIKTIDEIAILLKVFIELGFCYCEAPHCFHHENFSVISEFLMPTHEEVDIRVARTELGEQPQYALTFGIGTEKNDLGLQSDGLGRIAGKAIFGAVNMKTRLALFCDQFDKTQSEHAAKKLIYYKIPLKQSERLPLETYAKRWETFFEKLINHSKTGLPTIASVSRSTARILIALQDLGAFYQSNGEFDFNKAQIVANCMMAFILHGSHHSFSEIAEVYNRLLDYNAIDHLEKKGPSKEFIESNMPYYRIGAYSSFFHKAYADKVVLDVSSLSPQRKHGSCR